MFSLPCSNHFFLFFSAGRHCPLDEFQCNNTLCKPLAWKCDGEDDCGDNSDETPEECRECRLVNHTRVECLSVFIFCPDLSSFSVRLLGKFQCPPTRAFRCQNDRVCLQVSKRCDGVNHCSDNADELNCRKLWSHSNCCEIPSFLNFEEIADLCVCGVMCLQRSLQLFPHVRRTSSCVPMEDASAPLCAVTSLTTVRTMALMRSTARQVAHVKTDFYIIA